MKNVEPTRRVRLIKVGNSIGVSLPKEVLARLNVSEGDTLLIAETADGILLTRSDSELNTIMDAAEIVMREDRDVLRVLAQ